jgi:hypothetical protein
MSSSDSLLATSTNDSEIPVVSSSNENVEFTRSNIEALGTNVRIVDSDPDTGLDLFCYVNCQKTDSSLLQQCRGVVFDKDKLVLKTFPYTIELSEHSDKQEIINNINLSECEVYDSFEGSIIKMFYYGGKWFVSTNRKLDAFRSKWASRESFGFFFKQALQYEFENNERIKDSGISFNPETDNVIDVFAENVLSKDKQYVFLLLNNVENRIVCDEAVRPTIYHVGTYIDGDLRMDEDIYIPYPLKHSFEDTEDLFSYVNKVDYKKLQGVIVFAPNNVQYKILNIDYQDLYRARGNEPSINFRFLQVRMDKVKNDMLRYLYPDKIKTFEHYENNLFDVSKNIYESYVQRFIKKQFVTLPTEEFKVMSMAHEWHQLDRENNRITHTKIIEILNDQPPINLNRIMRRIKFDKKNEALDRPKVHKNFPIKKVGSQQRLLPRNNSSQTSLKDKGEENNE